MTKPLPPRSELDKRAHEVRRHFERMKNNPPPKPIDEEKVQQIVDKAKKRIYKEQQTQDDPTQKQQTTNEPNQNQVGQHNQQQNQETNSLPQQLTQEHKTKELRQKIKEQVPEIIEQHKTTKEVTKRIDGTNPYARLTPEMKRAVVKTYEENLQLDFQGVAKALGIGLGTVQRVLQESPAALERARYKRKAYILDQLDTGLMYMAMRFRESLERGDIELSAKTASQFGVLFGIMVDKRQLLSGGATERKEVTAGTFDERKKAMTDILERAKDTLQLVAGGKK